jgi:hypothetical protein
VTTYWSTTGSSWTTIGSVTLPLGASAYVGIAVTSPQRGSQDNRDGERCQRHPKEPSAGTAEP